MPHSGKLSGRGLKDLRIWG